MSSELPFLSNRALKRKRKQEKKLANQLARQAAERDAELDLTSLLNDVGKGARSSSKSSAQPQQLPLEPRSAYDSLLTQLSSKKRRKTVADSSMNKTKSKRRNEDDDNDDFAAVGDNDDRNDVDDEDNDSIQLFETQSSSKTMPLSTKPTAAIVVSSTKTSTSATISTKSVSSASTNDAGHDDELDVAASDPYQRHFGVNNVTVPTADATEQERAHRTLSTLADGSVLSSDTDATFAMLSTGFSELLHVKSSSKLIARVVVRLSDFLLAA